MNQRLTIPLTNLQRESESVLELKDARIVPFSLVDNKVASIVTKIFRTAPPFYFGTAVNSDIRVAFDRVLIAFKLFKNEPLLARVFFIDGEVHEFQEYIYYVGPARQTTPLYHLTLDEETRFKQFWEHHRTINSSNFAVYRFHLADYGPYLRSSFVNYVESLEYLLVPDSDEGEISYKFRSRGAIILGINESPEAKKNIFQRLKWEYSLRSAIVHGNDESEPMQRLSKLSGSDLGWDDALSLVRNDSRLTIRYFFREGCLDDRSKRRELLETRLIFEFARGND